MGWTFDPLQLAPIALAALLYARRFATLASRDLPVPRARAASFAAALLVLVLAVTSPLATIGETRLFSVHMAQHLLIGDVAPLLIVLGLTRPLIEPLGTLRPLLRMRALAHPLIVLPLWAADLWLWHLPALYDAALANNAVHATEHACFLACGLLLWVTLLGIFPAPEWFGPGARLGGLACVSVTGGALANVFLWSNHAWYPPYVAAPRTWGLSPLTDQREGGGVMLIEMMFVGMVVFVILGLRWLAEAEARQQRREP